METMFFVCRAYRYKESHKWEYKMVGAYNDISAAKQAYYSAMSAIIKDSNDFASVILYDSWGAVVLHDFDITYVEPEPSEE